MISESVASLLSVCEIAIIKAIGEMISTSAGITKLVTPRKVTMVWPWLVIRSMPRNACVIQITPVRLTRTSANDASVVRKIYLSIDPIVPARSPSSEPEPAAAPDPEPEIPQRAAPPSRIGTLAHYLDRSTKWLCQGTFAISLIIREMWPASHVGAWQRSRGQVIVAGEFETCPDGTLRGTRKNPQNTPTRGCVPDPETALDFGGLPYARRRQGRLRPVFQRPARYSGGVLRRCAEVRLGHRQGVGRSGRDGQARC